MPVTHTDPNADTLAIFSSDTLETELARREGHIVGRSAWDREVTQRAFPEMELEERVAYLERRARLIDRLARGFEQRVLELRTAIERGR